MNFGIEKGKLIGLLGPSGSGKTTILRMMQVVETPDSGEVIIDGKVVNECSGQSSVGLYLYFRIMRCFVYDSL